VGFPPRWSWTCPSGPVAVPCRRRPLTSGRARSSARRGVSAAMRRVWHRQLAVLRRMPRGAAGARTAMVRAMWSPRTRRRRTLPRLPASAGRPRPGALPVRGARSGRDPSAEVLGLAERGRRACRCHGRRRSPAGRRRRMGAARATSAGRARVRPGSGARGCGRRQAGPAGPAAHASIDADRSAGATPWRRAAGGHARGVRAGPPSGGRAAPRHPRGRRLDDRGDGGGVRGRAFACGCP
jgi:hypothetical protein